MKEKRNFLRAKVKKSTCIAKDQGVYTFITESSVSIPVKIDVLDISTGGLSLITEVEILNGSDFDLLIQDIKTLSSATVKCKVTRSLFDQSNSTYEIGVRFIPANTDYLKKLIELLKNY